MSVIVLRVVIVVHEVPGIVEYELSRKIRMIRVDARIEDRDENPSSCFVLPSLGRIDVRVARLMKSPLLVEEGIVRELGKGASHDIRLGMGNPGNACKLVRQLTGRRARSDVELVVAVESVLGPYLGIPIGSRYARQRDLDAFDAVPLDRPVEIFPTRLDRVGAIRELPCKGLAQANQNPRIDEIAS